VSPAPAFVTAEEVTRELGRVADRLRVVGPRLASRAQQDDASAAGIARVREVLQRLADLAADGESRARREVPHLAPHALGDQALVLGHDVLLAARAAGEAGDDDRATSLLAEAAALLEGLRRAL
jgi:hypothetical protein